MGGFPTLKSGKLEGKLVDFLFENGGNRESYGEVPLSNKKMSV